jgi:hypothetical protein
VDPPLLRHPLERPLFALYATLNVVIVIAAFGIALQGADWAATHPILAKYHSHIRAIVTAAILGPFGMTLLRNTRHARIRGNSLPISTRQLPQVHEVFLRHCRRLEIDPPEIYYSDVATKEPVRAYKAWRIQYIVVGTRFLQPDLKPVLPVLSFLIGRELGRLRLGHASFPYDLLLSYVGKIPYLLNPLTRVFTYSEDRWGAYLAPEGIIGLAALASGRLMLPTIDLPDILSRIKNYTGAWAFTAEFVDETPPLAHRIKALLDGGFFQTETHDGVATRGTIAP